MLRQRFIPSLLLKGGRLVKGKQYQDHLDAGNPATTVRAHNHQGADEVILLDIEASAHNRGPNLEALREVAAECFVPLTYGGGIRSVEHGRACMDCGADKLSVTSAALDQPAMISDLARVFGSQAVVLGIDVTGPARAPRVYDYRRQRAVPGLDALQWAQQCIELGAGELRLTSVDREGTREGYDLQLIDRFVSNVDVPVVIDGGAGTLEHLAEAFNSRADGVACGTMLVFSDNNLIKIKRYLGSRNCNIRI